jgi:hypothetical protein
LIENNHTIPLVGLSWPSNTTWNEAKIIAKQDGPKLGHFIMDYFYDCKHQYDRNVNVRLISHSLGGRVILSALDELHNNMTWRNEGFKILSVHLMGAAVDDEEVSKNPSDITDDNSRIKSAYGEAIQAEVIRFYNLHNPEGNMLQPYPFFPDNPVYNVYPFFENDTALGQAGRQQQGIEEMDKVSAPPYYDINVTNEIERGPDADGLADMHPVFCGTYICNPTLIKEISIKGSDPALCLAFYVWGLIFADCRIDIGDNHAGYMGFRDNPTNRGIREYDGAIDVVVQHWLTPLN